MRSIRLVAMAALLSGVAIGCTGGDTTVSQPTVSARTTTPSILTFDVPTPEPPRIPEIGEPETRPAKWDVVRSWIRRNHGDSFGASNDRFVSLVAAPSTGRGYSTVETLSGKVLVHHDPGKGQWQTQDGWLAPHAAVYLDINFPKRIARISVYSLPSGARSSWSGDGERSDVTPEGDVADDTLVYFTGSPAERMCLRSVDLTTLKPRAHECGKKGEILGDPAVHDDRVTFTRLTGLTPKKRCKVINVLDLETGAHDVAAEKTIAAEADCLAWDGVSIDGGVAWDVADPNSAELAFGQGYMRTADGKLFDLGEMSTDSMVSCGGYLYWVNDESGSERVFQWEPGAAPTVVMDPGEDLGVTTFQCTEDRWLSTRTDEISGAKNEMLQVVTIDTRPQR